MFRKESVQYFPNVIWSIFVCLFIFLQDLHGRDRKKKHFWCFHDCCFTATRVKLRKALWPNNAVLDGETAKYLTTQIWCGCIGKPAFIWLSCEAHLFKLYCITANSFTLTCIPGGKLPYSQEDTKKFPGSSLAFPYFHPVNILSGSIVIIPKGLHSLLWDWDDMCLFSEKNIWFYEVSRLFGQKFWRYAK